MLAVFETAGFRLRKGYIIEREYAGEFRYLRVTASKRKPRKAIEAMKALSVHAVIPVNTELPRGFKLPDSSGAVVKAAAAAARQFSRMGQTAAVTSPRVSAEVKNVCKAILPYTRNLLLNCGSDTRYLAFWLLKEHGVAAVTEPPGVMLNEAGLKVAFGEYGAAVNGILLESGHIGLKNAPPAPRDVPFDIWHDALLESGAFEIGKIRIDNGDSMSYTTESVKRLG